MFMTTMQISSAESNLSTSFVAVSCGSLHIFIYFSLYSSMQLVFSFSSFSFFFLFGWFGLFGGVSVVHLYIKLGKQGCLASVIYSVYVFEWRSDGYKWWLELRDLKIYYMWGFGSFASVKGSLHIAFAKFTRDLTFFFIWWKKTNFTES